MNLITQTVEFDSEGSADPGSHKVREIVNLQPENAGKSSWKTFGKPRGFSRWDVDAILPQNEFRHFHEQLVSFAL